MEEFFFGQPLLHFDPHRHPRGSRDRRHFAGEGGGAIDLFTRGDALFDGRDDAAGRERRQRGDQTVCSPSAIAWPARASASAKQASSESDRRRAAAEQVIFIASL